MNKLFLWGVVLVFLTGCATAQKSSRSDMQQLQARMTFLEDELQNKDEQIGSMQQELQQVRQECSRKAQSDDWTEARPKYSAVSKTNKIAYDTGDIIRVEGVNADHVQLALKRAGFYQGAVDGKIGARTKDAIKSFQKAKGLKADGIIGRETWSKLKNNL